MKRIMLVIAYDGTNYSGWQIQNNAITIQQKVEEGLRNVTGVPVRAIGASRTDARVHALGNVAVFDTDLKMPPGKYVFALNANLPEDIRIQESKEVSYDFHPRFSKSVKTYEYRILNNRIQDPLRRNYTYFRYGDLDVEKMDYAASLLEGEHDFASYATENPKILSTVRNLITLSVRRVGDEIRIIAKGNGFLYHMVRILAGTLIEVGAGRYQPEHVLDILKAKNRAAAGPTAPPQGLCLKSIEYV